MAVELFSWPRKNVLDVGIELGGPLACQADTLPIELPRPARKVLLADIQMVSLRDLQLSSHLPDWLCSKWEKKNQRKKKYLQRAHKLDKALIVCVKEYSIYITVIYKYK